MNCFKLSLKLTLLSLLTCVLAAPAFAISDNDNSIRAADFEGNLNSGQGFRQIKPSNYSPKSSCRRLLRNYSQQTA